MDATSLKYITDEKGLNMAVVIPIEDWKAIEGAYREQLEVKASLTRSITQLKEIKAGTRKGRPVQELLNEL